MNKARRDGLAAGLTGVESPERGHGPQMPRQDALRWTWFVGWFEGYQRFLASERERILRHADAPTRAAVAAACSSYAGDPERVLRQAMQVPLRDRSICWGMFLKVRVLERLVDTILPARAGGADEDALADACESVSVVPPDRAWMQAAFEAYDRCSERSGAPS